MKSKSKRSLLVRFTPFMGKKKMLVPLSLFLSALSAVLNILPFIFIWLIVRGLFTDGLMEYGADVQTYAWLTFGTAFGGVFVYFLALVTSHLAAFSVEVGMRKYGMEKIMDMPLGLF